MSGSAFRTIVRAALRVPRHGRLALLLAATLLLSGCALVLPLQGGGALAAIITALSIAVAACGGGGSGGGGSGGGETTEPPAPSFAAADAKAALTDTEMVFTVTRAGDTESAASVSYATGDAGGFYTETSGTLSFAAGDTSATVAVPISASDSDDELTLRTITLTLSGPSEGAEISDATAYGGVIDDDMVIDAVTWDGRFGPRLEGAAEYDRAGESLAAGGDLNGDGIHDLVIGAPNADPDGQTNAGKVHVLTGLPDGPTASLADTGSSSLPGFTRASADASGRLGYSLAGVGDINGDGTDDLLIGSNSAYNLGAFAGDNIAAPQVLAIHGGSGLDGTSFVLGDQAAPYADGFIYHTGSTVADVGRMTRDVAPLGDFDGDGVNDFLLSSDDFVSSGLNDYGGAAIVSGASEDTVNLATSGTGAGWAGFLITAVDAANGFGIAAAPAGDVDGDGYADALVGRRDTGGAGSVYLIFGGANAFANADGVLCATPLDETDLASGGSYTCDGASVSFPDSVRIVGQGASDQFGTALAAGDVNGDGNTDILIGASRYDAGGAPYGWEEGRVHVILGDGTRTLSELVSEGELDLGDGALAVDGSRVFTITGAVVSGDGDRVGSAVATVDLDGDGRDDIVMGAPSAFQNDGTETSRAFVLWGRDDFTGTYGNVDLGTFVDESAGLGEGILIEGIPNQGGEAGTGEFGATVANVGDINGDGRTDLAIGAPGVIKGANYDYGAVYIILGAPFVKPDAE